MTDPTEHRQRVKALAVDFITRTGMAPADFARRIGYAYSTVQLFLTDKYTTMQSDKISAQPFSNSLNIIRWPRLKSSPAKSTRPEPLKRCAASLPA